MWVATLKAEGAGSDGERRRGERIPSWTCFVEKGPVTTTLVGREGNRSRGRERERERGRDGKGRGDETDHILIERLPWGIGLVEADLLTVRVEEGSHVFLVDDLG
jgi:hypothetical protein